MIHKMILQVCKHNKRYLLSSKLVRGIFAEQPTGRAIAQLLSRQENLPRVAAQRFASKIHAREVDVVQFAQFLKNELSEETLKYIQADPLTIFHRNSIELLATQTTEIWDCASDNQTAYLVRQEALLEHATHCSTQHNNERLVKLGTLMASTGKSEIMAGVFAVTLNDFMTDCHDLEEEQGHGEDEVVAGDKEQESTDLVDDGPARQKRGNYRGKKKLFDFQQTVELKEAKLAAVGQALGPIKFAKRQQAILKALLKALLSKTSDLKEKEGTEKMSKMMTTYDNEKAPNAHEKITGEDIPPRLLRYFSYRSLGVKKNKPELMKELGFHNLKYNEKEGVRNLQVILKEAEQARL
jgi:hypothetical protein